MLVFMIWVHPSVLIPRLAAKTFFLAEDIQDAPWQGEHFTVFRTEMSIILVFRWARAERQNVSARAKISPPGALHYSPVTTSSMR